MKQTVMLVDDHKIMRDGIKAILRRDPHFEVVAEAGTMAEAIEVCRATKPAIVIMDLHLGDISGIDITAEILRVRSDTRVVILSMADDEDTIMRALRAGARGFIVKTGSDTELLTALHEISAGRVFFASSISGRVVARLAGGCQDSATQHQALTTREQQVLRLVAQGKTSKEIAGMLKLGVHTVARYRNLLMKKLGVDNTAGLTQFAIRSGLVEPKYFGGDLLADR